MNREPLFIDLPDGRGKLYSPQPQGCRGKHPCPDCFSCQQCSPDRCAACRRDRIPTAHPPPLPVPDGCR
ncbi:MAG: hypothetical protein AB1413_10650 [Thermodesulfobacteriota bacterium]